ncbi:T9SS sorting signal type C domain-containing protein, partial [Flavobacterium alvei]|uniref:T9SS sorting signal type C domain-containing protein n=1 Tax=Flavobacterium alvei TaxID=2080416 RepID=UPI0026EFE7C3
PDSFKFSVNGINLAILGGQTYNITVCGAPVPNLTSLADVTGQCAATVTAPTATSNCYGQITATTPTSFPITAPGTTVVTWTYNDGNGQTSTQTQNVIISSTTYTTLSGWSNGTPAAGKGAIISGDLTIAANFTACSLTVNNNAVVTVNSGVNLDIYGDVNVAAGSSLNFENNSNLLQTKTTNGNSGNVNIKRNSSALFRLDYTLWSSPVTGTQTMIGFSPLTTTGRFYDYTTSTNKYSVVANTTPFSLAKGYLIRMPNTWVDYGAGSAASWTGTFTGVPNNGNFTYTMSLAGTGFNAIGNPYPSNLIIDNFINGNIGNINGTLYFWRKRNDAANLTSYSTCTTAGCSLVNSHIYPNTDYISIGQGFLVKATSTTLNFNNTMRIANNQNQFFKTKVVEKNRIWLNLYNDATPVNQMLLAYMTGATMEIDPTIDGAYINDSQTALNSLIGSEEYAVQGRALPFDTTDEVPLSFKAQNAGNYSIAIDHVDGLFSENQDIILKDNSNGTETNLKNQAYAFTAAAGATNTRFSLKYQKTLGISNPAFDENSIIVFKSNDKTHIKSSTKAIDNVKIYDIRGRLLLEKNKVNANETSFDSSKFANQVLIVQITSEDQTIVKKKVVN